MNLKQAQDFIRYHGVVLESAQGTEPSLAQRIAGERIQGSWWGHPKGHAIYELTQKIRESKAVLTCTLAKGRATYIHRRLWPAFARLSNRFSEHALDQVKEVHLPSGRHKREDIPFPTWVPDDMLSLSKTLTEVQAECQILIWLERYGVA